MESLCTDFQAEMMAILKFTELLLSKNMTRRKNIAAVVAGQQKQH
jgi:hypothetical protein